MMKILVVDDDIAMIRLYQLQLRLAGWEGFYFRDGTSALQQAAAIGPHLALLDYELPDFNATDLMKGLFAIPALAEMPVVLVTGQVRPEVNQALLEAGADAIFSKPFSPAQLLRKMRELLPRA